jgi:hypothetical protein
MYSETREFITIFIRSKRLFRSSARWIKSTLSDPVSWRFILILSYLHLLLPRRFLFFLFLYRDSTRIFVYFPYVPQATHFSFLLISSPEHYLAKSKYYQVRHYASFKENKRPVFSIIVTMLLLYAQYWRKPNTSDGKDRNDFPQVIARYAVIYRGYN